MRQFFSDLFEGLPEGKLMVLFEGEVDRRVPTYRPHVMSDYWRWLGKRLLIQLPKVVQDFPSWLTHVTTIWLLVISCVQWHTVMHGTFLIHLQELLS